MNIWSIIKQGIPLILGILIGAGLTRNKYVFGMIITYVILMLLFGLLRNKITTVKKSKDKKQALKDVGIETVTSVIDATAKGNQKGFNIFDKYYPEYIFYLNVILFISSIILLFKSEYFWALLTFGLLHFHIVINQIYRHTKRLK